MANEVKLTKELIEELINEELDNLSEEELLEQGWLSTLKGGYKGLKKAATGAWEAGVEEHSKAEFYNKYYKIFDEVTKMFDQAVQGFDQDVKDFGLKAGSTVITGLKNALETSYIHADDWRKKVKATGEAVGTMEKEKEKTSKGGGGEESEGGEEGEKSGLWDKAKSVASGVGGFLGMDEEQEVANDG